MAYKVFLNEQELTDYQIERFLQSEELNVLENYDFSFDEIAIKVPFEAKGLLNDLVDNVVTVRDDENEEVFKGYVATKMFDYKQQLIHMKAVPFIDLISKREEEYAQTSARPVLLLIKELLSSELPSYYTIAQFLQLRSGLEGIEVYVNTDGETTNVMNLIRDLCELVDVALFFKKLQIDLYAFGNYPTEATDITQYLLQHPTIKEMIKEYYNKVRLEYKNSVAGSDKVVTAGTGTIEKKIDISDVYFTDVVAQLIVDRKFEIVNRAYFETQFETQTNVEIIVGGYVIYDEYVFLVTKKEERPEKLKFDAIGIKLSGGE